MIVFGLTGGIASGKSTVSKTFSRIGVPVIDADQVARDVVVPGSDGLKDICKAFGSDYLLPDGNLDRIKLGNLVFHSQDDMLKLNHIMQPLIQYESYRQILRACNDGHEIICYDAALILEMGNYDRYKPLVVVACSPEMQLERLMKRNGLTEAQAMARINAQIPVAEKMKRADMIIDTNGPHEYSIKQTETVYLCLRVLLREHILKSKQL